MQILLLGRYISYEFSWLHNEIWSHLKTEYHVCSFQYRTEVQKYLKFLFSPLKVNCFCLLKYYFFSFYYDSSST